MIVEKGSSIINGIRGSFVGGYEFKGVPPKDNMYFTDGPAMTPLSKVYYVTGRSHD